MHSLLMSAELVGTFTLLKLKDPKNWAAQEGFDGRLIRISTLTLAVGFTFDLRVGREFLINIGQLA